MTDPDAVAAWIAAAPLRTPKPDPDAEVETSTPSAISAPNAVSTPDAISAPKAVSTPDAISTPDATVLPVHQPDDLSANQATNHRVNPGARTPTRPPDAQSNPKAAASTSATQKNLAQRQFAIGTAIGAYKYNWYVAGVIAVGARKSISCPYAY